MIEQAPAEKGNWEEFGENNNANNNASPKIPFMKFEKPGIYRIRLVGQHVTFLRYFKPIKAITHATYREEDPLVKAGFRPQKRYAIHVIDRADGKLKVLEKGEKTFEPFGSFMMLNKINPSGKDAPDFQIKVSIPMGKNGKPDIRLTEYSIQAARENSPLTAAEIEMYKKEKLPLNEIFKSTPLEKIKELWDTLPADQKIPVYKTAKNKTDTVKEATTVEEPIAETMKEAPAESGELFGNAEDNVGNAEEKTEAKDDSTELF